MGHFLEEVTAAPPENCRERVEARFHGLKEEVEGFCDVRQAVGKAQADVAAALDIKQSSVSKIEKQVDMHLSTLRSYVRAIGGDLELVVRLPSRAPIHLQSFGGIGASATTANQSRPTRRAKRAVWSKRVAKAG